MFKVVITIVVSFLLLSVMFSLASQFMLHLPYGWNIEATNSMYPLLKPGDLVFILPLSGNPHIGEIVAYKPPSFGVYLVHEVINVTPNGSYIIKGINNPTPDPWAVPRSWIKGYVPEVFGVPVAIPYIGYFISLSRSTLSYSAPISLIAIYSVSEVFSSKKIEIKRRKRDSDYVSPNYIALLFFILSLFAFLIFYSPHVFYNTIYWNSVNNAPKVSESFNQNLGAVPPNSNVTLLYTISYKSLVKLPLVILYDSSGNDITLDTQPTVYGSENATFDLFTSSEGLHSETIGIEILPQFLPLAILEWLFKLNPLLPLVAEGVEISSVISIIVYLISRKLE
ncbi:MAG: signal peptidase I [Metallosphaera sp.]|uniref:signal peptidase I n=1 Tax=Metallosphaera sp. TaxID=2020860 RepID=UPI003162211E